MAYLPLYNAEQARRHQVQPGITGWAQVNGRNALTWEQKFDQDLHYLDHVSPGFDLRVLALTVREVFRGRGISQDGHATARPFVGTALEDR